MNNNIDEKKKYYIGTLDKKWDDFQSFTTNKDIDNIRAFGHKLKGSGKAFGFNEISKLGNELEEAALNNDFEGTLIIKNKLEKLFKEIKNKYSS